MNSAFFSKIEYEASDGSTGAVGSQPLAFLQTAGEEWDFGPDGCATGFGLSFVDDSSKALKLLTIEAETGMTLLTVPICEPVAAADITKNFIRNVNEDGARVESIIEDSSQLFEGLNPRCSNTFTVTDASSTNV